MIRRGFPQAVVQEAPQAQAIRHAPADTRSLAMLSKESDQQAAGEYTLKWHRRASQFRCGNSHGIVLRSRM